MFRFNFSFHFQIIYSSLYEVVVDFTRDYDAIKQALYNVKHFDKTCLENLLQAASVSLMTNWGSQNQCQVHNFETILQAMWQNGRLFLVQVLVFTHCGLGLGSTSLPATIRKLKLRGSNPVKNSPSAMDEDTTSNENWIPFVSSCKLNFICIGSPLDTYFQQAIKVYQEFLDVSGQKGQLYITKPENDSDSLPTSAQWKYEIIQSLVNRLCEHNFKPFEATLKCGGYQRLEGPIIIWPSPMVRFIFSCGSANQCKF